MSKRPLPNSSANVSQTPPQVRKRVANACTRCRKYKARCDSYRPCALCQRNNAVCEPHQRVPEVPASSSAPASKPLNRESQRATRSHNIGYSPVSTTSGLSGTLNRATSSGDADQSQRPEAVHHSPSNSSWLEDQDDSTSAIAIARKIYQLRRDGIAIHTTSAIPDGDCERVSPSPHQSFGQRAPIPVLLNHRFPSREQILMLMEEFFDTVHWFSLVIYEPTFRKLLSAVEDGYAYPSDAPFLTLLCIVLSMASWYRANKSDDDAHRHEWQAWSDELRGIVEGRMLQLMGQPSILATQTCILLGSHHVYHGQPNLSFSLLGATIKMAHALGLHRHPTRGNSHCIEERKRVWWTIYTWDRFASISHCRPLSINEKDCDVEMPSDFTESPCFTSQSSVVQDLEPVCYSRYQKELSSLYATASPALEEIFGSISTQPSRRNFESTYATLVSRITESLMQWHQELPPHLDWARARVQNLDGGSGGPRRASRAHALQSLALQMTFDNLLIVLYRPCLATYIDDFPTKYPKEGPWQHRQDTSSVVASPAKEVVNGTEHWCTAALRTTQMTEYSRIIQIATNSHLMVFMAMNMFHSAVVLIILALTDPLSDDTQAIKRSITRVLHLQKTLGQHSTFSKQTSDVMKLLIHRLLQREQEAILGSDDVPAGDIPPNTAEKGRTAWYSRSMSHMPTLPSDNGNLPFPDRHRETLDRSSDGQNWTNLAIAQRLDEGLTSVRQAFNMTRNPSTSQEFDVSLANVDDTTMPELGYLQAGWQLPPQPSYLDGGTITSPVDYMAEQPMDSLFWLWNLRRDVDE